MPTRLRDVVVGDRAGAQRKLSECGFPGDVLLTAPVGEYFATDIGAADGTGASGEAHSPANDLGTSGALQEGL